MKVSLLDHDSAPPNFGVLVVRVIQLEEIRVEIRSGVVDFVGEDHHFSSALRVVRAEADLRNRQGWSGQAEDCEDCYLLYRELSIAHVVQVQDLLTENWLTNLNNIKCFLCYHFILLCFHLHNLTRIGPQKCFEAKF